ncbi:MAG: cupin domain-containing protein [Candidatus Binatia bacterium]
MEKSPILNLDDVEYTNWGIGGAFETKLGAVANRLGAKKLGYRVVALPPGRKAWPFHLHHVNEEMFFVLEGNGTLRFGDHQYPVKAGDVICCPPGPGTAHQIVNTSDSELKYLAVSTMEPAEVAEYPDSGKFGVMAGRPPGAAPSQAAFWLVARKDAAVDYWEGES